MFSCTAKTAPLVTFSELRKVQRAYRNKDRQCSPSLRFLCDLLALPQRLCLVSINKDDIVDIVVAAVAVSIRSVRSRFGGGGFLSDDNVFIHFQTVASFDPAFCIVANDGTAVELLEMLQCGAPC
jgi:hypothetical protein